MLRTCLEVRYTFHIGNCYNRIYNLICLCHGKTYTKNVMQCLLAHTPLPWETFDLTVPAPIPFKFVDSPDLVPWRTISTWRSRVLHVYSLDRTDYDNQEYLRVMSSLHFRCFNLTVVRPNIWSLANLFIRVQTCLLFICLVTFISEF